MEYTIQNGQLTLVASTHGAEARELHGLGSAPWGWLWEGKASVWGRWAPICFPWCGKLDEGWFEDEGKRYYGGQHGFIRDVEHTLVEQGEDHLVFRFDWTADGERWPWSFTFETCHKLEGNSLVTTCTVTNRDSRPMPIQLGFHPGLRCPFDPAKTPQDYQIRFEKPESLDGTEIFALDEHVFDNDSICFPDLKSEWVQVEEKGTGRYLRVDTKGFPFVLLWSKPGIPDFVCIEPWTGYPGPGHDLMGRPGAMLLAGGDSFRRTQRITVG